MNPSPSSTLARFERAISSAAFLVDFLCQLVCGRHNPALDATVPGRRQPIRIASQPALVTAFAEHATRRNVCHHVIRITRYPRLLWAELRLQSKRIVDDHFATQKNPSQVVA